jgi:hypothetical protein
MGSGNESRTEAIAVGEAKDSDIIEAQPEPQSKDSKKKIMSYCRWSSDDFQCDIYCYAHCDGGFRIHVANRRYVFKEPLPAEISFSDNATAWAEREMKVQEMVHNASLEKIDLPCAGEDYHVATAREAAAHLERLRGLGFRVPQYAIDSLLQDASDETPAT